MNQPAILKAIDDIGLLADPSPPNGPLHSPLCESTIRTIKQGTSALLLQSGLSEQHWPALLCLLLFLSVPSGGGKRALLRGQRPEGGQRPAMVVFWDSCNIPMNVGIGLASCLICMSRCPDLRNPRRQPQLLMTLLNCRRQICRKRITRPLSFQEVIPLPESPDASGVVMKPVQREKGKEVWFIEFYCYPDSAISRAAQKFGISYLGVTKDILNVAARCFRTSSKVVRLRTCGGASHVRFGLNGNPWPFIKGVSCLDTS